ncbi:MAG: TonB-dependent receptor [Ignavibacteriaceae bacterium]|nr:TonB-dependent receptor [Ignavibacteriaceae bacterium]
MMIRAAFILFILSTVLYGQTGNVSGDVRSSAGYLPGVNILVDGTTIGASTDLNGKFRISGIPAGPRKLRFSFVGYKTIFQDVEVIAGKTVEISVTMNETEAIKVSEVTVLGKDLRKPSETETSIIDLNPDRAKILAGAGEDVLRTLQALPGVLAPNDFSSQLIIRGSGPDQNLIIIDNVEIFNPYRLYGFISMFNPDAVSDISLITGGFPSKYGDRLSAVLDVTNREGNLSKSITGSVNASVTNANVILEGKNPFNIRGSWLLNSRRTYYDLILEPIARNNGLVEDNVAFPSFYDLQAKLAFGPFDGHKFLLTGIYSADGVNIVSGKNRRSPDSISVNNVTRNDVAAFTHQYAPNNRFLSETTVSWYKNSGDTGFDSDVLDPSLNREAFNDGNFRIDTLRQYLYNFKVTSDFRFEKTTIENKSALFWGNNLLEFGGGVDFFTITIRFDFEIDDQLRAIFSSNPNFRSAVSDLADVKTYKRYKAFAQNRFYFSENFYATAGLRFDNYEILNKSYIAPRLALSYGLDNLTTIRAAWGVYYQSPGYEKLRDQGVFFDLTEKYTRDLQAEKSVHYVLGLERWLSTEWNLRVEAYYKDFTDLIVPKRVQGTKYYTEQIPGRDPRYPSGWTRPVAVLSDSITQIPVNDSYGESYGLEFLIAKKNRDASSRISGWISYALSFSDRVENNLTLPFRFDQRHTVNIVIDYAINDVWNIGLRWQYGSGFPNTFPMGIKPRVIMVDTDGDLKPDAPAISTKQSFSQPGVQEVAYDIDFGDGSKFNGRKPVYHRLDVRISALANFWGLRWDFYLDVINAYNRSNIIGYDYYVNDDLTLGTEPTSMLPIIPTLGVSIKF